MTSARSDRLLLAVGGIAVTAALTSAVLATSCPAILERPQNVAAIATSILAGALVMRSGVSGDGPWLLLGTVGAGISAGLWLQPSLGGLIGIMVAVVAASSLRRAPDRTALVLGVPLLVAGIVAGVSLQVLLSGTPVRC